MKDKLQGLLDFLRDTDLTEIFWQQKADSINVKRFRRAAPAPVSASSDAEAASASGVVEGNGLSSVPTPLLIRSSMVGTFYRSDSKKDRPPLVIEGTIVNAGQPVGCVEAMKIMKDVLSPQACRIVKALVDNGHAVEYGQPLFEVAPLDETNV